MDYCQKKKEKKKKDCSQGGSKLAVSRSANSNADPDVDAGAPRWRTALARLEEQNVENTKNHAFIIYSETEGTH